MQIANKFKGLKGLELLGLVNNANPVVDIAGEPVNLVPCTLPFANCAEISKKEDATYVACKTRFMSRDILVRV